MPRVSLGMPVYNGERFIGYAGRLLKNFGTAEGAPPALASLCGRRRIK